MRRGQRGAHFGHQRVRVVHRTFSRGKQRTVGSRTFEAQGDHMFSQIGEHLLPLLKQTEQTIVIDAERIAGFTRQYVSRITDCQRFTCGALDRRTTDDARDAD